MGVACESESLSILTLDSAAVLGSKEVMGEPKKHEKQEQTTVQALE